MIIAINTGFLLNDYYEEYRHFLKEAFNQIAKDNPEHQFIFIHRKHQEEFVFEKNVMPVSIKISNWHPLLLKWWYDAKIPAILKKYKADVLICCDGYVSLHTKVPQCFFIHDLSFLQSSPFIKRSQQGYLIKQVPKFLQKSTSIVTFSESSKKNILTHYKTNSEKINVVYTAAKDIFYPLHEDEKEMTREKYTNGKNYFIYSGMIHPANNLLNLLKAFSIFKKRQKSDWKLLLAGNPAPGYKDFSEKIKSYKHRGDVIWIENVEEKEMAKLIRSSYALINTAANFSMSPLQSIQCNIPMIVSTNDIMQEIFGEAALYMDTADHNDIAEKMMMIYKDEELRKRLIEKGKLLAKNYTWDKTINLLWQTILKAVS